MDLNTNQVFNRIVEIFKQKVNITFEDEDDDTDYIVFKYNDFSYSIKNYCFRKFGSTTFKKLSDLEKLFDVPGDYVLMINDINNAINNFALEIIYTYHDYLYSYNQSPNEYYRITEKLSTEYVKATINEEKTIIALMISCLDHSSLLYKIYETIITPDDFFESSDYDDLHKEAVKKVSEKIYTQLKTFK